jgi:hypothetical protein
VLITPKGVGNRLSRQGLPWAEDVELLTLTKCSVAPDIVKEAVDGGGVVVQEIVSERHFDSFASAPPRHSWLLIPHPWAGRNLVEFLTLVPSGLA